MSCRVWIRSLLWLVVWMIGVAPVRSTTESTTTRPNIVVIMADDLGWMDAHFQGNPLLDTPNLDRLARQGMRFTDAYAAAPVCSPTRAAIYFHYPNCAFHTGNRLGGAIREGDFKLIRNYDDDSVELYNLATDLGETRNLAATEPATTAKLKTKLDAWLKSSGARMPVRVAAKE